MKKESKKLKTDSQSTSLKISANSDDNLTKNQKLFNSLTKEIEELEKDILDTSAKMQELLEYYSINYKPILIDSAQLRIQLAMAIDQSTERFKFTKKQLEHAKVVIINLCSDAFSEIEPNDKQIEFYDKWSEESYKEELKLQETITKDTIANFFESMFGVDINPNDFGSDAQGYAEFQQKLHSEFEKIKEEEEIKQSKKKKTKKQIKAEEDLKLREETKNKSIRSIYITLAKILHPDSETDPKLKIEKEEIMKRVTLAYDQKDLTTLLRLELEWVHKETKHLEKISDDKLKIYISALKEQIYELFQKKQMIGIDPRFEGISDYLHLTRRKAINIIKSNIKEENEIKSDFTNLISEFEQSKDKKIIMKFVKTYLEELDENNDFFDRDLNFFF